MSDMDDGDTPLVGRWCRCGLLAGSDVNDVESGNCPDCGRSWPLNVVQRYDYDGGPKMKDNPVVAERSRLKFENAKRLREELEEEKKRLLKQKYQDEEVGRILREGEVKWRKNPDYEPLTLEQKMGYLVEECGEVLAALGKTQRWGLDSKNPELEDGEANVDWLLRELRDLEDAINILRYELVENRDYNSGG